jgi:hypothetical protein
LISRAVIGLKEISGGFRMEEHEHTTRIVRLKETISAFSSTPWRTCKDL